MINPTRTAPKWNPSLRGDKQVTSRMSFGTAMYAVRTIMKWESQSNLQEPVLTLVKQQRITVKIGLRADN